MCGGGGGDTTINYPDPPAQPSTADAVNAYVANMPKMMDIQMQYAPQLAQQQYDVMAGLAPSYVSMLTGLSSQYAPAIAAQSWDLQNQYAPMYAAQQQSLQQEYEPEAYAARQSLGGLLTDDYLTSYTPPEGLGADMARNRITQDVRGAWADRGLAKSGMSAEDEVKMLAEFEFPYQLQREQLGLQELGRRQNVALSLAGRYGVPNIQGISMPTTPTPSVSTPNMMGGYDFGGVSSYMMGGYGNYMNAWSQQQNTLANAQLQQSLQPSGWGQLAGQVVGAAGQIGAAKIMFGCFSDDTDVICETGIKKIKDLKPGDKVLGKGQWVEVKEVFTYDGHTELVINSVVRVTGKHPFVREDESLVLAEDLKLGDKLYGDVEITSLKKETAGTKIYNIEVENHLFTVYPNVVVHDGREKEVAHG